MELNKTRWMGCSKDLKRWCQGHRKKFGLYHEDAHVAAEVQNENQRQIANHQE